jgi:hypothetical protein
VKKKDKSRKAVLGRYGLFVALTIHLLLTTAYARAADDEDVVPLPARVDVIRIVGLVRTQPFVVMRELRFKEGDVVTKEMIDLAVTRLWNTTIFAQVQCGVHYEALFPKGSGEPSFLPPHDVPPPPPPPPPGSKTHNVVVHCVLEDRWTLNPLFSFGSGGGALFVRVGASDNNLFGRFLEAQAQYENFDGFHGGQAIFRNPRLFDQRVELLVQADRLVRPRQGFSDQRTQGIVEIAKLADQDRLRFGLRARVFANRFLAPLETPPFYPAPTETFAIEPSFRIGRIDLVRLRYKGTSLELRPGVGITNSDVADAYATLTGEVLSFLMLGERWNLAVRLRGSNISRVPPHLELWAGGLDLLRGFTDNFIRTRAFSLANVEMRFTAFDSTWIALMPTAFVDALAARSPAGPPGSALSVGAGLRILVPKFVGTGLRADLAIPLHEDMRAVGVTEQFRLGPVTPDAKIGTVQPSIGVFQFF